MIKTIPKTSTRSYSYVWVILVLAFCSSCVSVQEYEKMYLNEEEMALEAGKLESYELSFQSYREGASGANGAAVGGGCGCR